MRIIADAKMIGIGRVSGSVRYLLAHLEATKTLIKFAIDHKDIGGDEALQKFDEIRAREVNDLYLAIEEEVE